MMRRVLRNMGWSISGQLTSLSIGMVAVPILLHRLGAARLGAFTLALGFLGFSGLFDLGLGRALTQLVASSIGASRAREQLSRLVWALIAMLMALGGVWAFALWIVAPWMVTELLHLQNAIAKETIFGLRALALSLPFALAATGSMGALEGLQKFRTLSVGRVATSSLQFGLPVAVACWRPNLGYAIGALACVRFVAFLLWAWQLHLELPWARMVAVDRRALRRTLRFGGWLSVSNLVGPLMIYADRFYLANVFPPAGVAYYTVPFDAVHRATALPQTALNVLFPAIAEQRGDAEKLVPVLDLAIRGLIVVGLPIVVGLAVAAQPLLAAWLGPIFAERATGVLRWLLVGVFLNAFAHVPYALIQAHGRTDLTAKMHLFELPLFAGALWFLVRFYGVDGAALAWFLRVALDAVLLYAAAWYLHVALRRVLLRAIWLLVAMGILIPAAVFLLPTWMHYGAVALILAWSVVEVFRLGAAFKATPRDREGG